MEGDLRVVELLNEALANELVAINQYWLHYRLLDHWGVHTLAQLERHESIDEMKHADRLMERILFLGGRPRVRNLGQLRTGASVEAVLRGDLDLELEAVAQLRPAVQHCEAARDYVSRDLFSDILRDEEAHIDFLERQFELIDRIGSEQYIQLNSKPAAA